MPALPYALLRRHPLAALLALALLLGLAFQGTRGLWEPDEGRYTNVALQMLHSGDFVTLRRNDTALHFTKPPVTYWAIAASVSAFGRSEWAVRLPIALAYVLTVGLLFQLGKRFVPDKPWLPALMYATAPVPFFGAYSVNTDTMLAATETLAVACYVHERFGGGSRRWLDAMWTAFGLAFLTKGPPALLPLVAILVFEASERGLPRLLSRPLGLLGFALVGLGWYAVVIGLHPGLLDYFLGHEVYARIATAELDRFPQWYGPFFVYLPTLLLGTLPWWPLALRRRQADAASANAPALAEDASAAKAARGWRAWPAQKRFLLCWLLLPMLVFCLARSRLPLYLLPSFVPLSLLLARALAPRRWHAGAVLLLAAWVLALLGLKYYLGAAYPSDKDARIFAARLQGMLPGHPEHLMFVEDMARNGLNLYFDSDIQRLSFTPEPKALSDSTYDQTVAQALAQRQRGRIFVMKREAEARFLSEASRAGARPLLLGTLPETHARLVLDGWRPVYRITTRPNRRVYTLDGDYPVPGPLRRD
jgi:4-amino-4-deoxy-L-arabinose transferase-like glycosyltransferase